MSLFDPVGIVGAGAWGTALAIAAARAGRKVLLFGRDSGQMKEMARTRVNRRYLPQIVLTDAISPVSDMAALTAARLVLLATPAQTTRQVAQALALVLRPTVPLIITAKGIERETGLYPGEIAADLLPGHPVALLSGPSFAADVARGLPTAVALACGDAIIAEALAKALNSASFRIYHTTDRRGVEIGGAAKNVLAIAAGIVEGQGLGESAKAALIARGFAEIGRFARAFGGEMETLMGLSGLGDLVLTCGSGRSRNFRFGKALAMGSAQGKASPDMASPHELAEGAFTAGILSELAATRGVDMPICAAVAAIVEGRISVRDAIERLVSRPQRAEQ